MKCGAPCHVSHERTAWMCVGAEGTKQTADDAGWMSVIGGEKTAEVM